MPTYEENRADPFSITVLIGIVLIIVFLIIATIYFSNMMNFKPPSKSESTFLFWTSLLLTIVATVIAIFAIIHIFTHKHITHVIQANTEPHHDVDLHIHHDDHIVEVHHDERPVRKVPTKPLVKTEPVRVATRSPQRSDSSELSASTRKRLHLLNLD